MSGRRSRNKGQRGEREFLGKLGEELGEMLKRNLLQTRESGCDCTELHGWAIEIKRQEKLSRGAWWRQACEQAEKLGVQPMLAYRRNNEDWRVWVKQGEDLTIAQAAGVIREKWMGWP